MPVPSLKLSAISKRYPGVQALAEMSFECLPGEIHAVLGENGSGKSTLLGIASGAVAQDSGTIEIMGAPLVAADQAGSHRRRARGPLRQRVSRCTVCLPQREQNFLSSRRSGVLRRFFVVM